MAFSLENHWVWDFWLADDGDLFHLFFLQAPRDLGDPDLRHRNATVGHATSTNLVDWTPRGTALGPGAPSSFDGSSTWTGSVVRGPDDGWWMFYTGSRFPSPASATNIETIGIARSNDLISWTKLPGPVLRADPRWYETLGTSSWSEEAWRDPWVYRDPAGDGWHMLVTARANHGDDWGRGVIGHAVSADLEHWEARPPLSSPQAGFGHLEVTQLVEIDGKSILVFCCNSPRLANQRASGMGGIWTAPGVAGQQFDISKCTLLADERLYAGRLVQDRAGRWNLLAFIMAAPDGSFPGEICDPIPVGWRDGALVLAGPIPSSSNPTPLSVA
jgi:beta-fructofuranosidase